MARYRGPVCKLCRREGTKLFLKGSRCYTEKCSFERRSYPPGHHGRRRGKLSDYGIQLREKQKMRRLYGVLEKQFRKYYHMAERQGGVTGDNLVRLLEQRLDNVVYRMKLAASRRQARQIVRHGHVRVNGRRVDIPSYQVKVNDQITLHEPSKKLKVVAEAIESGSRQVPEWLEVNPNDMSGTVARLPEREELDLPFREQLVVELYSK